MDGVHPHWCGVRNGGGCCCPGRSSGVARATPIPVQYSSVLLSCRVLFVAGCVVRVGEYLSEVFVWWGILRPPPPGRGGGWGCRGWWCGVTRRGGIVTEGRWCYWPPFKCWCSPSVCWRPPCCLSVVLLNGGRGLCCGVPVFEWCGALVLSCCSCVLCCRHCCGWGNAVVSVVRLPPLLCRVSQCVLSIVAYASLHGVTCGVVLWESGGVRCEWRAWWCALCDVFCCSLFLPLPPFVLVFGVVRAQPCEHARYPRTPLCFSCCFVSSSVCSALLSVFLPLSSFLLLEWRRVIHHVSECSVGMTATGSLSLSSAFFW